MLSSSCKISGANVEDEAGALAVVSMLGWLLRLGKDEEPHFVISTVAIKRKLRREHFSELAFLPDEELQGPEKMRPR